MKSKFAWVVFYSEFADRLLQYQMDRKKLLEKVYQLYENTNLKMPKLDDGEPVDIDPFTVFGLFNKGISDRNRILIMKELKALFQMSAEVPDDFAGIPVLNNLNATFYAFKDYRGEEDIDNLWAVFVAALALDSEESESNRTAFIQSYDQVKDLKGNRWKLTMGLYWIRPYSYINLDSRNRWFIMEPGKMPDNCSTIIKGMNSIPSGADYLEMCEIFRTALENGNYSYKNLPELSAEAWNVSQEVNQLLKNRNDEEDALGDDSEVGVRYWMYAAGTGSQRWDEFYQKGIMVIGWGEIGDLTQYPGKEAIKTAMSEVYDQESSFKNSANATWQFVHDIKPGDIVFVKRGLHEIIGRGIVASEYRFEPKGDGEFKNVRDVEWTHKGNWTIKDQIAQKTLTDITRYSELIATLNSFFEEENAEEPEQSVVRYEAYDEADFLKDVFMNVTDYHKLVGVLKQKKNIILQGAPGVGKTYAAKRLAYSIMGLKDTSRVKMIQFHQSYSYEDFIMGFRPTEAGGFKLHTGAFYDFCKEAEIDSENEYFFIIDEINRGNISKIFGEMFMLVESDKRGVELELLYKKEKFSIPKNVYIIGMMNTADRSLAMMDYALRRRFAFFDFAPAFGTDSFEEYRIKKNNSRFDQLIKTVMQLNETIESDESLGEGFRIGHSYFVTKNEITDDFLDSIVEYELIPLLREYWFDEPSKVSYWSGNLRRAIK